MDGHELIKLHFSQYTFKCSSIFVTFLGRKLHNWVLIDTYKQTSRERPKSAPYLRLNMTQKPLFLQLETTKALKKLKSEKKVFPNFFSKIFLKSPVSRIVP